MISLVSGDVCLPVKLKDKYLFNCTTNVVGGGKKNSVLFILNAIEDTTVEWYFAISSEVAYELKSLNVCTERFFVFVNSPSKDIRARRKLLALEKKINPKVVYTMAGPAYVDFKSIHFLGLSNAFVTHCDFSTFFVGRTFIQSIIEISRSLYQLCWSLKSNVIFVQTNAAKHGISSRLFFKKIDIKVISNAVGNDFKEKLVEPKEFDHQNVVIFCPSAAYAHKGLDSIPKIAKELALKSKCALGFKFVLTVDRNSALYQRIENEAKLLGVFENIQTIGPYKYKDGLGHYLNSDFVYVPSLLETFSSTYLEAFMARRPLIVSNRGFARDICGDAAMFIEPFNPIDAANSIFELIYDENKQAELINKGVEQLKHYPTQKERYHSIMSAISNSLRQ